jgi:hypothetical protein
MQSVEEFMAGYLRERIAIEVRELELLAPFRRRFFASACRWDSRAGTLDLIKSERVFHVSNSDNKSEVVTTSRDPRNGKEVRLRYHLRRERLNWLIEAVEWECLSCFGERGETSCPICGGAGWRSGMRGRSCNDNGT